MIDTGSIIIAYTDGSPGPGKFVVHKTSDGAVEVAAVTFEAGDTDNKSVTMLDADSFLIAYQGGTGGPGKYVVYNIDGTPEVTATVFEAGDTDWISAVKVDAYSVAIAYRDVTDTNKGKLMVELISNRASHPTITIDTANSNALSAFWIEDGTTIAKKKGSTPYAAANWTTALDLVTTGTNAWLSSGYDAGGLVEPIVLARQVCLALYLCERELDKRAERDS